MIYESRPYRKGSRKRKKWTDNKYKAYRYNGSVIKLKLLELYPEFPAGYIVMRFFQSVNSTTDSPTLFRKTYLIRIKI